MINSTSYQKHIDERVRPMEAGWVGHRWIQCQVSGLPHRAFVNAEKISLQIFWNLASSKHHKVNFQGGSPFSLFRINMSRIFDTCAGLVDSSEVGTS